MSLKSNTYYAANEDIHNSSSIKEDIPFVKSILSLRKMVEMRSMQALYSFVKGISSVLLESSFFEAATRCTVSPPMFLTVMKLCIAFAGEQ